MKKLLFFCLFLMSVVFVGQSQKTNLDLLQVQKKDALRFEPGSTTFDFPAGFTYIDRNASKNSKLYASVGVASCYLTAGYDVSFPEGTKITKLTYLLNRLAENKKPGKVFIASRPGTKPFDTDDNAAHVYTVEYVAEVTDQKDGLNEYVFPTPFVVDPQKAYYVGYEVYDSGSKEKPEYPMGMVYSTPIPQANLTSFKKGESAIGEVGSQMSDVLNVASLDFGNFAMVIGVEDPKNPQNYQVLLSQKDQNFFVSKDVEYNHVVDIVNNSLASIPSVELQLFEVKDGNKTPLKTLSIDQPLAALEKKSLSISLPTDKTGSFDYELAVTKVDGKELSWGPVTISFHAKIRDEKEWILTYNVLVERFSTELCGYCPSGDKIMREVAKKIKDFNLITVYHHAGYYTDFLTLPESEKIAQIMGVLFAPSVMLNRFANDVMRKNAYGKPGSLVLGVGPKLETVYREAAANKSQTRLMRISRVGEGANTKLVVEGKTLAANPDEVYLSVWREEDGILASNGGNGQANGGGGFIHDFVLRKVYTTSNGVKVTINADKTFKMEVPIADYSSDWDPEKMRFVVFIHRDLNNENMGNRYVHDAQYFSVDATTGVRELSPEDRPIAYENNGKIEVKGLYDDYVVYDITGRQINAEENLPSGVYVVKAKKGTMEYISKLVIR